MDRLAAAAVVLILLLLGLRSTRRVLQAVRERQAFLLEFGELFGRYVQGGGGDDALYVNLTQRIVRMQRDMGPHGVLAVYRPPFAGYALKNVPILLNMLPEYQRCVNDWALRSQAQQYASTIRDALMRYSGSLNEFEERALKEAASPLVWARDGARQVVSAPVRGLAALGILSDGSESRILGSALLRVGSGLVALATLVAALIEIVTGWGPASVLLHQITGP